MLLDQVRFDRVAERAALTGISVNAVIREAIDLHVDYSHRQAGAMVWLLEHTAAEEAQTAVSWEDQKRAMDQELVDRWG